MLLKKIFTIIFSVFLCSTAAFAQCDTAVFAADSVQWVFCDSNTLFDGYGKAYAVEKVGDTLYVGGKFTHVGRFSGSYIGLDTASGALYKQPTWPKTDGQVYMAIPDGSGGMFIGGTFSRVGDSFRTNLARINAAGQVTAFDIDIQQPVAPHGSRGLINAGVVYNGILYIGGDFATVNANIRYALAAINISTGAITSWSPTVNGAVYAMATDGTFIYAGGTFTANNLVKINMATGAIVSSLGGVFSTGQVTSIVVQNNFLYGCGANYSGDRIKKIDLATNAVVSAFAPGGNSPVLSLLAIDNKIYACGAFSSIGGKTRRGIVALDTATGSATNWDPNITGGTVYALSLMGNKIYAAGNFSTVGTSSRRTIAAIDTTTGIAGNFQVSANPYAIIYTLLPYGNKMYVGGDFAVLDGVYRRNLAAINLRSNSLSSWNHSATLGLSGSIPVRTMKAENNKLYIGGDFESVDGISRNHAAQFDLGNNSLFSFDPLSTASFSGAGYVTKILLQPSYAYIAGSFSITSNGSHRSIVRVDKSTGSIDSWAPNLNSSTAEVNDMTIAGNSIYITGDVTNNSAGKCILIKNNLLTGVSTYLPTATGTGAGSAVCVIDNRIYVAGSFNKIAGVSRGNIAAFDTATLSIRPYNPFGGATGIRSLSRYYNVLCITGTNVFNTATYPIGRNGVIMCDTAVGNFISTWPSYGFPTTEQALFIGDTLYTAGPYYNAARKKLFGLTLYKISPSPAISITASTLTPCSSNSVTLTSNATAVISYQWIKNGAAVSGATGATYTFTPVAGDSIVCIGSGSFTGCYTGPVYTTSNAVVFNSIASNITATASISASPLASVCSGTPVTYTCATNVTGGTYQWKVGSTNVGTNTNTYSFNPTNGDVITCEVTKASGTCYSPSPVISNTITAAVTANTTPTAALSASPTGAVCAGTSVTYTCNTNISGGSYQWKVGSTVVGTNSNTYIYVPSNGDVIGCEVTKATGTCYTPTSITSTAITAAVTANTTLTATISPSSSGAVCSGTNITYTCATNITGADYQWKVGTTNVGTNSATYIYAPSNGDVISCIVTKPVSACFAPASITSNTLTALVTANTTPTASISANPSTPVCAGASVTYTCTTNVIGGSYQWRMGTTNVGTNSSTYSYVPSNGDAISCVVTVPAGCYTLSSVTSNIITASVTANTTPTASISANPTSVVCSGASLTYTCATNVTGGSYQWKVGTTNVGTNSNTYTYTPANGDVISCVVTVGTGCYTSSSVTSNTITTTVTANVTPTASVSSVPTGAVCAGTSVTYTCATSITGASYQWKLGSTNVGINSSTYTYTPANGDIISCEVTKPSGSCYFPATVTGIAAPALVTPNTIPTAAITANPTGAICIGTSVSYTCNTNVTGSSYQWKVGSTNVGTSNNTYTYTSVNGDVISCIITTPTAGCYNPTTQPSNNINMVVTAKQVPAITISGPAIIAVGNTVTVNAAISNAGSSYSVSWYLNGGFVSTTTIPSLTYTKAAGTDVIKATVKPNGCYDSTISTPITIQDNVGINSITGDKEIFIYPNPFDNYVSVKGLSKGDNITLYDLAGKKIQSAVMVDENSDNYIYKIKNVSAGSYFIEIRNDQQQLKKTILLEKHQ